MKIRKSIARDEYEIENVRKIVWMNTYPNEKAGITVADIENKFKADTNTNVKLKQKIGEK